MLATSIEAFTYPDQGIFAENTIMRIGHPIIAMALTALTAFATSALLVGCGGGSGGGSSETSSAPVPAQSPIATLSSYTPANGAAGVAIGTPLIIKLAVANATSSDASKVTWICGGKTVTFTSASSLSSDAATMTITMTPAVSASSSGDVCTYNGTVTTVGPGGSVGTPVGTSYTNAIAGTGGTPLPSTAAISAFMSVTYASDKIALAADVQALEQTLASQGLLCSNDEIVALANLKEMHVQTFLNKVIADIEIEKTKNPLDKTALAVLIDSYQSQDLAWISSPNLGSCGFSAAQISATGYATAINSYYVHWFSQLVAI